MSLGCENEAMQDARFLQQLFRRMENLNCLIREQPDRFRRSMA